MFNFGSPEDTARLYLEGASQTGGGGLQDKNYSEMSEEQLRNTLIYYRIAYYRATMSEASEDVVDVIVAGHDELFLYLLEGMDGFRDLVCSRIHSPLNDWKKYYELAGCEPSAN